MDIQSALRDGELLLHYQPIVDLVRTQTVGAEALLRWQHPTGGLLPPADFLEDATHTLVMPTITDWVLETACVAAAQWGDLGISVNVTAVDIAQPDFVQRVESAVARAGLAPGRLTLELTEQTLVQDIATATVQLRELVNAGMHVMLDDFGTGYSSMLYLRHLPITGIKIDRQFVNGVLTDADDAAIVAGLIQLGHIVGVRVVAEGVECAEQEAALMALGCDCAQGFHYGEPVPGFPEMKRTEHAPIPRVTTKNGNGSLAPGAEKLVRRHLAEGASLHTIAAALNRHGFRTSSGSRWTSSSVARALTHLFRA